MRVTLAICPGTYGSVAAGWNFWAIKAQQVQVYKMRYKWVILVIKKGHQTFSQLCKDHIQVESVNKKILAK